MKLIYTELYGINNNLKDSKKIKGNCIPTLEIHYTESEKHILPSLKAEIIENEDIDLNIAYLNFSYGLFASLSENTINKLESMLNFSKKINHGSEYLNKDMWKPFLFTSSITLSPIKKSINSNISTFDGNKNKHKGTKAIFKSFYKDKDQLFIEKYYSASETIFDNNAYIIQNNLYKKLINNFFITGKKEKENKNLKRKYKMSFADNINISIINIMRNGFFNGAVNIDYEIQFKTELELLYSFLDCIFSSEYKFHIKKCVKCKKFFITLKTDTKYCPICKDIVVKSQKTIFDNPKIRKLERKINSLYTANYVNATERKKFYEDKQNAKAQFFNNEEGLKNWYLSHYKTEKARKNNDYKVK